MHTLERDRHVRLNVTMILMKICSTVLIESNIRHQKTARLDYQVLLEKMNPREQRKSSLTNCLHEFINISILAKLFGSQFL